MKKALIAYFSQGGTTKKIATEIANGLSEAGYKQPIFTASRMIHPLTSMITTLLALGHRSMFLDRRLTYWTT